MSAIRSSQILTESSEAINNNKEDGLESNDSTTHRETISKRPTVNKPTPFIVHSFEGNSIFSSRPCGVCKKSVFLICYRCTGNNILELVLQITSFLLNYQILI